MAKTYSLIQAQILTGSAASVTFSNIPQNFTDLVIKYSAKTTRTNDPNGDDLKIYFNGDTGSNYSNKTILGTGSSVSAENIVSTNLGIYGIVAADGTSNFGNGEIHIPNYAGSRAKSISMDCVSERNNTNAYLRVVAGYWTGTAAITSVSFFPGTGPNFAAGTTFYLYGVGGTRATGGTITSDANFTYHTFTSTSTFTALEKIKNAEVLLVAGGGGGGWDTGGGGGAGGVTSIVGQTLLAGTSYTALVGAGGSGGTTTNGSSGANSMFAVTQAVGGGGGGGSGSFTGLTGGSGGGAGYGSGVYPTTGASGTSGQGNKGGNVTASQQGGAGGGGAGAAGNNAAGNYNGGNGGIGTIAYNTWHYATSTGVSSGGTYHIAGGGGGGCGDINRKGGTGGTGGGGVGGDPSNSNQTSGTANTGGGGGGGAGNGSPRTGAAGGSGLVIVRYPSN
jgi:hypothetical protein